MRALFIIAPNADTLSAEVTKAIDDGMQPRAPVGSYSSVLVQWMVEGSGVETYKVFGDVSPVRLVERIEAAGMSVLARPELIDGVYLAAGVTGEIGGDGDGIQWADIEGKPASYPTTWNQVGSKPAVIAAGATQAAARDAIGAGTSNLALGTTASTAAAGNHTHTAAAIGAATADHTHTAADIGAAPADHTHTAADVGAATADHTHTAADFGAAPASHTHTAADVGAAPASHTHTATQVTATAVGGGTATDVQGILAELDARIAALETPA